MIFALSGLLQRDPVAAFAFIACFLIAILVAISVHEASHAFMAHRLGDDTARRMGRLSLNPLRHLDPLGTIMLVIAGFGWGKPVPVDPYSLRVGPKAGMGLVSVAGPASNFLVAGILGLLVRSGALAWHPFGFGIPFVQKTVPWITADLVGSIITFNIVLGVFNLIPLAPLDGSKVLLGILPRPLAIPVARLEQYGSMILMGIVAFDIFFHVGILGSILDPGLSLATRILVGR